MYTADKARAQQKKDLDEKIEQAVREAGTANHATIRIYMEDDYRYSIKEELEKRGFINVFVPDIILKGDVHFEWER